MNKKVSSVLVAGFLAVLLAIPSFAGRETRFRTDGPEGGPILRLVFSPDDPNYVLACGFFGGIYFSEDGGRTWTRTSTAGVLGSTFNAAFDPLMPSVVYAATYGAARSEDSGRTWTNASTGLPGFRVNCLVVDSVHEGTVLAGTASGLYRTVDSGASWSPFGSGLLAGQSINALSVDPTNPGTILAATNNETVYRSTDGGATWGHVAGLPASPSIAAVEFDPTTPGRAFAGDSTVYRSADHGASWNAVSDSSFVGNVSQFAFLPGVILVAQNNGLLKSTNGGVSWTEFHNGIPGGETYFNGVAVSPGASPVILAGGEANGVVRSTDGGSTWAVAKSGLLANVGPLAIAVDPSNPRRAVAGLSFSGGVRTADGGRTWTWINELGIGNVFSVVAVPGVAGDFVAGTFGAYRSTDAGVTWHASSPQIQDNVYSLAAGTSASHPLFAGTQSQKVLKSTDGGASWHSASAGLPSEPVNALSVGPAPAAVIYAGLSNGSVWASTNSGASWHPSGAALDSSAVVSLGADPNHANVIFAGTLHGLYRSTDGGSSWASLDTAVGATGYVFGIALPTGASDTVFATVFGSGVFVSRDDGATWGPLDPNFSHVLYSDLAVTIATDATGQWIYEGSQSAGIFQMSPVSIVPGAKAVPREVEGRNP
jgi:photosystem II stability/assembly factor-like uncharacterized protein